MKRFLAMLILISLMLSGCMGWLDGHYHNVSRYEDGGSQQVAEVLKVANFEELCSALAEMTRTGTESGLISVAEYDQSRVHSDLRLAVERVLKQDPIAAYAVEKIDCEVGTSGGQPAIAVTISYLHDAAEIRKIKQIKDLDAAKTAIHAELDQCASGIVIYLEQYQEADFAQIVEDYADSCPHKVIETPQVTVNVFPEEGEERVVELKFLYQSSRDTLRNMQSQVKTLFNAAANYVSVTVDSREKYSQMYSFLMERFQNYQIETSITPAYSLLLHGVGDAKAFAVVYAAMCREAGMECYVVTGTRSGEPWFWNLVQIEESWFHVDLLRCNEQGFFQEYDDSQMNGYVWDYSAYQTGSAEDLP
ncbi:MAG: transglutaminase domain-containing protein [Faecousia sp.]